MQRTKLDEFNKLFKEANLINIKNKAKELTQRTDLYERFLFTKKSEFENKNYTSFLTQVQDIEKYVKLSEKLVKEANDLVKE
jgi:hypothetical protein